MHLAILIINDREVYTLANPEEIISVCEKTWAEFARGKVINPARLSLNLGEEGEWPGLSAFMNAMPAYVDWLNVVGLKWVGGFWNNRRVGLPFISAVILLADPHNGIFKALIEGSIVTSLRTAAQTAIGIRYLARKDSKVVGIYGAGTQARYHIYLLSRIYPYLKYIICGTREETIQRTIDILEEKFKVKATIHIAKKPEECALESDIIVTLTTSRQPFLKPEWIKEGHLIAALGSYQELYDEAIKKANKIVIDHIEQALRRGCLKKLVEKGELTEKDIYATIGEIIIGLKHGRESNDEIILFVPIGTGMLDVAVAELIYRKALENHMGKYVILVTDKRLH